MQEQATAFSPVGNLIYLALTGSIKKKKKTENKSLLFARLLKTQETVPQVTNSSKLLPERFLSNFCAKM